MISNNVIYNNSNNLATSKAMLPVKAQLLDNDEMKAWFAGRVPRRILTIPFGGPIPSAKSALGVDMDGEWFSERTDIFGPYPELRRTRERLVDFHHSAQPPGPRYGDPTGMMRGSYLGKSILDPDPEQDGWWSDFWFKEGDKRVALIAKLAAMGTQLFGSSQPVSKAVVTNHETGEIMVWPHWLQTISPAPQNTFSVIRAKAVLDTVAGDPYWSDVENALRDLGSDLRTASEMGSDAAKAGRVHSASDMEDIQAAIDAAQAGLERMRKLVARQPEYGVRDAEAVTP